MDDNPSNNSKTFNFNFLKLFANENSTQNIKIINSNKTKNEKIIKAYLKQLESNSYNREADSNSNIKDFKFKNYNEIMNDLTKLENEYETDTSFNEISKAFGLYDKFNKSRNLNIDTSFSSYGNDDEWLTIQEKITTDILNDSNPETSFSIGNKHSKQIILKRKSEDIKANKKQNSIYEINFNKIEADPRTTLMIKNIPNKFTKELMLNMINKNYRGSFNFFHLPIDYNNNCNMGYAFINFLKNSFVKDFYLEYNNKRWNLFHSEKVCEIKYARYQGFDYHKNIKKYNAKAYNFGN